MNPSCKIAISRINEGELKIIRETFKFKVLRNGIDYILIAPDASPTSTELIKTILNRFKPA